MQWVPIMVCATLLDPNQPYRYFTASPVRAREHQIRAPEKGTLGGMSRPPYPGNVTVYPYNRYIRGTNPIVRHVMSLTCTPAPVPANPHAHKHAATQSLHHPGRVHTGGARVAIFGCICTGGHVSLIFLLLAPVLPGVVHMAQQPQLLHGRSRCHSMQ